MELAVGCPTMEFLQVLRRSFRPKVNLRLLLATAELSNLVGTKRVLQEMLAGCDMTLYATSVQTRKGCLHGMEVYHSKPRTATRMCRDPGNELQKCPKESSWRSYFDTDSELYIRVC